MADPIKIAMKLASSGIAAQSKRMQIVSENLANVQSTGSTPGSDPYRRKTVTFEAAMDEVTGANLVKVDRVGTDDKPFRIEHDPSHPAADANGNVKLPNVDMLVELADMREANRSYEANLQVIKQVRSMSSMTIDLLRN